MTGKAACAKLAAFLTAVVLMLGSFFGNMDIMNASALAEDTDLQEMNTETGLQSAADETAPGETEEAIRQAVASDEASADKAAEEEAVPQVSDEETVAEEIEEAVPEAAEPEAASADKAAEEEAVPQVTDEESIAEEIKEAVPEAAEPEEGSVTPAAESEDVPQLPEEETVFEEIEEVVPEAAGPEEEAASEDDRETAPESGPEPEDNGSNEQAGILPGDGTDVADDPQDEEDLIAVDDDDCGNVSDEILDPFNNPELYEQAEFVGTAEIMLLNEGMFSYGDEIILRAVIRDVNVNCRLIWEANDGRGWFAVGSGEEYSFILDRDNAEREYRVVLFAVV